MPRARAITCQSHEQRAGVADKNAVQAETGAKGDQEATGSIRRRLGLRSLSLWPRKTQAVQNHWNYRQRKRLDSDAPQIRRQRSGRFAYRIRRKNLQEQARSLGGNWDRKQKVWLIRYGCIAGTTAMEKLIVLETMDNWFWSKFINV